MSKPNRIIGSVATVTAGLAFALAPMAATPVRAATEHVVDIRDMAFAPGTLTIAVGDTVTWTNSDSMPHTATSEDDAFDSGNLDQGQSFSFTFNEPGTNEYRCDYHSDMSGTIVVEAAGQGQPAPSAAPTGAANPDTALPGADGGMQLPTLLMGLGLVVVAISVIRLRPQVVARVTRPGGGWNR